MPLTDDEIKALLEGTEGVTPGPWFTLTDRHAHHAAFAYSSTVRGGSWESYEDFALVAYEPDAVHIARCDPGTIAELCTRLLSAEAENERLRRMVKDAYNDGFSEGMKEAGNGGKSWSDCKYKTELEQANATD
jgi:hypothetical protein